jgi:hypothetical protein
MALLNHTTKIEADKTAAEIERILVKHGARAFIKEYGPDKGIIALSFQVPMPQGQLGYRLPVDADATLKVLERQYQLGQLRHSFVNHQQAVRTAWRIVKDWVEAQMAILETEMVTMAQIFLPYMLTPSGKTVYESLEEKGFYLPEGRG